MYFTTKINYEKIGVEGRVFVAKETYLLEAYSFTEAEARITEEMKSFISGSWQIKKINPENISELFLNENSELFFKAKVNFITDDEKLGKSKKTAVYMLVQADNVKDAEQKLTEGMKGALADYSIEAITETKILQVFR